MEDGRRTVGRSGVLRAQVVYGMGSRVGSA